MKAHGITQQKDVSQIEMWPDWVKDAECTKSQLDLDIFFSNSEGMRSKAKRICVMCPVRMECLKYGIDIPYGIYGGFTWQERYELKGRNGRATGKGYSFFGDSSITRELISKAHRQRLEKPFTKSSSKTSPKN